MTVLSPNSITYRSISYAAAARLVAIAVEHAQSKGWRVCATVCDASGSVVAVGRMDGAPSTVADFALDKAFTAATSGKSTRAFYERMSSSKELSMGLANRPRLIAWQGGLPILEGKSVIGGIGVSGAAGDEDVECAQKALNALGMEQSA
jgi:glc operon protein GlcG